MQASPRDQDLMGPTRLTEAAPAVSAARARVHPRGPDWPPPPPGLAGLRPLPPLPLPLQLPAGRSPARSPAPAGARCCSLASRGLPLKWTGLTSHAVPKWVREVGAGAVTGVPAQGWQV